MKMNLLNLLACFFATLRGKKMLLANEASNRSANHWKRKAALAIGRPEMVDASDDDLDEAHDQHMQTVYELCKTTDDGELSNSAGPYLGAYGEDNNLPMPPGPAQTTAQMQKLQARIASLVQEAMTSQGISYTAAIQYVRLVYPQYFPETQRPGVPHQQLANESRRREEFFSLVNGRIAAGMDRTDAFVSVQRENPDLLP